MSSIIMHLIASNEIKEKYGFSNEYLAGSILPDVVKVLKNDRKSSHYIKEIKITGDFYKQIPDVEEFIIKNPNYRNKPNLFGYASHLIEDKIWFEEYVSMYADYVDLKTKQIHYVEDDKFHEGTEFSKIMNEDYNIIDSELLKQYNMNIVEVKNDIIGYFKDECKPIVNKLVVSGEIKENHTLRFLTMEICKKYIEECTEKITKVIDC